MNHSGSSFRRHSARATFALCLLFLAACGKIPLFTELPEAEANEMMAILLQRDIGCTKLAGKDEKWTLRVTPEDFSRAVDLLKAQGYPKDRFARIGDVFQKTGLVSSPTEERIRYMYALSQELAGTLMRIDGVLNARVHIVIPDNDPLATKVTPSSAAVFIRHRSGFDIESLSPQLKNLVMRSIEGLNYDNVSLVLVPAAADAALSATPRSSTAAVGPDWMLLGAVGAASAAVGAWLLWAFQRQSGRRSVKEAAA